MNSLTAATIPEIGSRWSICKGKRIKPSVYELVRVGGSDPLHEYTLRLVSFDASQGKIACYEVGYEITVERQWFDVRGAMGAREVGAVRRVQP